MVELEDDEDDEEAKEDQKASKKNLQPPDEDTSGVNLTNDGTNLQGFNVGVDDEKTHEVGNI